MINFPDLAAFPDYMSEPRCSSSANLQAMENAIVDNDFDAFCRGLAIDMNLKWCVRLKHFFDFYRSWREPDYSVTQLEHGVCVFQHDVSQIWHAVSAVVDQLLTKADWVPPPGTFDRGVQLPALCLPINAIFEKIGIINLSSRYLRRQLQVSNVFLHVATPSDKHWRQFFYDAVTTPRHTNTHIDPKQDVMKALIYLTDVDNTNGPFHFFEGSNQFKFNPVQNIFGRAISTGSYCHSPESRSSIFRLPPELRVSHNFGRCAINGSALQKTLDQNLKPITSERGNIILFDPGAGIHQGGICKEKNRYALQVLMK